MAGESSSATASSVTGPAPWMVDNWRNWVTGMQGLGPPPVYGGPTVADLSPYQRTAGDLGYNMATQGTYAGNAARGATGQIAGGGAMNPYMGDNPYLQKMINSGMADITKAYGEGVGAQTDAAAIQAGAYGGSGYANQVANNQKMLGQTLSNFDTGIRYQNYSDSAKLYNDYINQRINASQVGLAGERNNMDMTKMLNDFGMQQQQYGQNVLNGLQNNWTQQAMSPYIWQQMLGNAYGMVPGSSYNATQDNTSDPGSYNRWLQAIGAGSTLIGAIPWKT